MPTDDADTDLVSDQKRHWDETLATNADMFGTEPSEPGVAACRLFVSEGVKRVLELGAGQGRDSFPFAEAGLNVVAVDVAESGVVAIGARAAAGSTTGRVSVVRHDAHTALPFADASFEACYSHMLFCMALTTPEIKRLAGEVRRVLRPGGLAVYTVRHTGDEHHGTGRALGDDMFEHGGFVVHFFDQALVDELADGFDLIDVAGFSEGALPRRLWRVTMRAA